MFIEALMIIVKTQKQPKCPPTEEWIKKTWYVYKGILFSHSQEWNNAICSNMDVPRDGQTDWSKSDREGEIP